MKDDREAANWRARTVNRVVGIAIARLVEAERVEAWVNTTLSQAMRGEVDGLAIHLQGFLARKGLRIETFQLEIGRVIVQPRLAMKGTIHLLQPSSGELTLILREHQLLDYLKMRFEEPVQGYKIHQIHTAFLPENQIQISLNWAAATKLIQSSTLLTTPEITSEGQAIHLVVQSIAGAPVPAEAVAAILSPMDEILSLHDFQQRGTAFQIQQLEMTPETLTLHATATIHQFPTR